MNKNVLYFFAFILAFCSIGYEFAIARTLAEMTGRGSQAQAMTIAFYILGLGIGAHFAQKGTTAPLRQLVLVETAVAGVGAISIFCIQILHLAMYSLLINDKVFLISAQSISVIVGILSGFELPYLLALVRTANDERRTNLTLGLNYFGSMIAAIACNYLFFPNLSGNQTVFAFAILNLISAASLLAFIEGKKVRLQLGVAFVAFAMAFFVRFIVKIDRTYLQSFYSMHAQVEAGIPLLERLESLDSKIGVDRIRTPYQAIDFVKRRFMDVKDGSLIYVWADFLYINGQPQVQIGKETVYHELMAHTPLALTGIIPKNVLVLGGGDGFLANELFRHPAIESITLVELDSAMVHEASTRSLLTESNGRVFNNPRLRVVIQDAYVYVRTAQDKFDAIYIDLPFPFDEDLNKLYSVEFYSNVRRLMKPSSVMTLDFPIGKSDGTSGIIFSTLRQAGFEAVVGYGTIDSFVSAAGEDVHFGKSTAHPLISELSQRFNVLRDDISDQSEFDPRLVNSALKPLLVGH